MNINTLEDQDNLSFAEAEFKTAIATISLEHVTFRNSHKKQAENLKTASITSKVNFADSDKEMALSDLENNNNRFVKTQSKLLGKNVSPIKLPKRRCKNCPKVNTTVSETAAITNNRRKTISTLKIVKSERLLDLKLEASTVKATNCTCQAILRRSTRISKPVDKLEINPSRLKTYL